MEKKNLKISGNNFLQRVLPGQEVILQDLTSSVEPRDEQLRPSKEGFGLVQDLLLYCSPRPHVALQTLQSLHSENPPSIGSTVSEKLQKS